MQILNYLNPYPVDFDELSGDKSCSSGKKSQHTALETPPHDNTPIAMPHLSLLWCKQRHLKQPSLICSEQKMATAFFAADKNGSKDVWFLPTLMLHHLPFWSSKDDQEATLHTSFQRQTLVNTLFTDLALSVYHHGNYSTFLGQRLWELK